MGENGWVKMGGWRRVDGDGWVEMGGGRWVDKNFYDSPARGRHGQSIPTQHRSQCQYERVYQ